MKCSGCGAPNRRIDLCRACSPDSPRVHDARSIARRRQTKPRREEEPDPPPLSDTPVRTSTSGWRLTFVPFGADFHQTLAARLKTADEGVQLAAMYNSLEWETHQGLGTDAMVAVGRKGSFVLKPVLR